MEVLLQMVQKLGHQEQLIPDALLVPQQVAKHRIKLTNAQIPTVLDSAISITSKVRTTQTASGVASATINQPLGKCQDR